MNETEFREKYGIQVLAGRFGGISNDDYHAAPGISKSHLDTIIDRSPAHYYEAYLNPNREPVVESPALALGKAIHSAILEPDDFIKSYAVAPKVDMRTKSGKEAMAAFQIENAGRNLLTDDQYNTCLKIRDAVHRHPIASGLLSSGAAEVSFFSRDAETEEIVKCRTDYITDNGQYVIDIKSAADASPVAFGKSAANHRYDLAPPWYFDVIESATGVTPSQWVWLAFEKEPPYAIGVYYATPEMIMAGRRAARAALHRIVAAKRANQFPDYGTEVLPLLLPAWVKR